MKKILHTLYLRLDSSSKSLTKRALAQLILKIIYSFPDDPNKEEIAGELAGVLGTNISTDKIDDALELLLTDKKIFDQHGVFHIAANKRGKIKTAYDEFVNRQNRILEKFFTGISTPQNFVAQWFEDVTIKFFSEYSSEWISDLCLTTNGAVKNKQQGIHAILDVLTDENSNIFIKDIPYLKKQYITFLFSNDTDVSSILWDYGTSCFSSSLITANTSADPITIEEFTDAKCILDTNILMYLDLELSKFKESFTSMENIFIQLNISPVYFSITREEFIKSMKNKKDTVLRVVENYSQQVIAETDDPFIQTAIFRECVSEEDFIQFFYQLMDIPAVISESLEIKEYDTLALEAAIQKGQKDEKLIEQINNVYKRKRHRDKRRHPLIHDAGLISGTEHIRQTEKCFILSRDISVNEVASENSVRNEMPISIGLDTLINVLAIDNGGTDIDPTNYAPLFASIIKLALIPDHDIFMVEDLARMLDVQSQIADLPNEKIIDIAKELHHNTVSGVNEEEISLHLTRSFQSAKLELQSDLDKSRKETFFEKTEKEKYIQSSQKAKQKLREKYTGDLQNKYEKLLFRNRVIIFGILPFATIVLTAVCINIITESPKTPWVSYLIGVVSNIVAWGFTDFLYLDKRVLSRYSERVNDISDIVEKRIREETEEL